jgi:hypothetical protein
MIGRAAHQISASLLFVLAAIAADVALADAPPPLSGDWDQWSANRNYVAHGDFSANKIFVERITSAGRERLWSISPWLNLHYTVLVADDGASLVTAPWAGKGAGELQQVVLTFYDDGVKGREWRLDSFFADTGLLVGSVSHWGWYRGMTWSDGQLIVTTVDGRRFAFDRKGDAVK